MPVINSFSGEHRFLSNFYPIHILYDGIVYPTVEHAFQASKTLIRGERISIQIADSPTLAKQRGRRCTLRPDWEDVKLGIMENILRVKFAIPEMHRQLLLTKGSTLVEGNTWHDTYWGVHNGKGENHLGKLLMKVRDA